MGQALDRSAVVRQQTEVPQPSSDIRGQSIELLSSSAVGSTNRGRVLQALFDLGPTSRADLARPAGVNRTTISGIVQPLIDADLLVEIGPAPGSHGVGKPAGRCGSRANAQPICGVLLMPESGPCLHRHARGQDRD